ncbi:MAG: hypothetical protein V1676_03270 [Candidatus Diapherotrites archaeon]
MLSGKSTLAGFLLALMLLISGCADVENYAPSGGNGVKFETTKVLPPNGNVSPSFKVGDKFEYKETMPGWGGAGTRVFVVKDMERIRGKKYYVISEDYKAKYTTPTGDARTEGRQATYYFDTETGYFLKRIQGGKTITEGSGSADIDLQIGSILFGQWMLSLTDHFEMERPIESKIGDKEFYYKDRFEVVETPLINGRKAFKVEYKIIENGTTTKKEVFWIDYEKRITVKKDVFQGATKVAEVNLISELS